MAKILLLDDSPVMHRVVRLTFADDSQMEIAVARTPAEADQSLSTGQVDLIIAYVRFAGVIDARYFEALSFASPRILLLAESEENLDEFLRAGFTSILRKPFHSDELRQVVEDLLSKEPTARRATASQTQPVQIPPLPPSPAPSVRPQAPTPPPAMSAPAPVPPPTNRSAAAPLPPPSFGGQASADEANEDTVDFTRKQGTKVKSMDVNSKSEHPKNSESGSNEPKITMDLSFFQAAVESSSPHFVRAASQPPAEFTNSEFSRTTSIEFNSESSLTETPVLPPRASASVGKSARSIEPSPWDAGPMTLEDVIVSTRVAPPSQGPISREDVEKIVEDAVAIAVSKAVRQALNETLPDLRQGLVNEVSQRAVDQLSAELQSVKKALRESMLQEVRDISAQWLRKETPILAKDVIREEIRKVIEGV